MCRVCGEEEEREGEGGRERERQRMGVYGDFRQESKIVYGQMFWICFMC